MDRLWLIYFMCVSVVSGDGNSSRLRERFLVDGSVISVTINHEKPIQTISDKFLSVTVDAAQAKYHLAHFHMNVTRVRNLAKGLSPAYFRFGGTSADQLSFKSGPSSDTILTEKELDQLYKFSKSVGWEMIFNINNLHRSEGKWDPTNAESLLKYAARKGYVFHLELGNEPNLYERNGHHVDPVQIGRDYGVLRHLMDSIPPFNHRMLLGPALTGHFPGDFCQKFLTYGWQYIDTFTVHHYYMSGDSATQAKFLDPTVLDSLMTTIERVEKCLSGKGHRPIWIGETSSAYHGGASDLSGSFISGFLWLDKLGLAAVNGIPVVARQDFVGARYALLSPQDQPLPDYWLSLLFKRLVGKKVLKVTSSEHNHRFRVYAHCSADQTHPKGVTFFFQNMYDSEVKFTAAQYTHHYYLQYILTAGDNGSLTSMTVKLNGQDLHMNGDSLPHIEPISDRTWPVKIPKHSFGFLVSPRANVSACP